MDIAPLNDNDDLTCLDVPLGNATPWQIKLKMAPVPSGEEVKIVSDGMPCTWVDLIVTVNTTDSSVSREYSFCLATLHSNRPNCNGPNVMPFTHTFPCEIYIDLP